MLCMRMRSFILALAHPQETSPGYGTAELPAEKHGPTRPRPRAGRRPEVAGGFCTSFPRKPGTPGLQKDSRGLQALGQLHPLE